MIKYINIFKFFKSIGYLSLDTINSQIIVEYTKLGSLVKQNIRDQWFHAQHEIPVEYIKSTSNLKEYINSDWSLVPKQMYSSTCFQKLSQNNKLYVPLGLSTTLSADLHCSTLFQHLRYSDISKPFDIQFKSSTLDTEILSNSFFVHPSVANEYFNRVQRSKKIWWMKLTSSAGNIIISEQKLLKYGIETVTINLKTEYGELELEKIQKIQQNDIFDNESYYIRMQCAKSNLEIIPAIIRSDICLNVATLCILIDSFQSEENQTLHLNRKLAPYQCALLRLADNKTSNELQCMAEYIGLLLKAKKISTLNLENNNVPYSQLSNLQAEMQKLDIIGVPFTLILEKECLSSGMIKLRNRDTTIPELIHLTDIPNYICQIMKS